MSEQQAVGVLPPFSAIQPGDQAGKVWIVTILATIYVILSALVRAYVKWGIYEADDYLLVIATFMYLAQSGSILYALDHGLSRFNSITTETDWVISGRSFIASEIFTIFTLCLAKCSVVLLMHRVFSSNTGWRFWSHIATLCLSVAWGVGAMIYIPTGCKTNTVLTSKGTTQCSGQTGQWLIVTITDIITDILICVLPIALIWRLHMPFKRKSQVVVAFAFRLPLVVFSALHFVHIKRYPTTDEPLYYVTGAIIQQQCMLLWSLISATIPNLKAFIQSFSLDFGMGMGLDTSQKSSSHPLENLTVGFAQTGTWRKIRNSGHDGRGTISSNLRPDAHQNRSVVFHHVAGDGDSFTSNGSQDRITRKVVDWHVRSEPSKESDTGGR